MVWWLLGALVLMFGLGVVRGAPYLPVLKNERRAALDLVNLKPGQTIIDLGCGDGRLLRAAAARGLTAIGYEINPALVAVSWVVCWPYRRRVQLHVANFWTVKLPPTDAIYVFLLDRYMPDLDRKLNTQLTQPTLVVSHVFAIPGRTPIRQAAMSRVYQYPAEAGSPRPSATRSHSGPATHRKQPSIEKPTHEV